MASTMELPSASLARLAGLEGRAAKLGLFVEAHPRRLSQVRLATPWASVDRAHGLLGEKPSLPAGDGPGALRVEADAP
jgi:hypothetical protein